MSLRLLVIPVVFTYVDDLLLLLRQVAGRLHRANHGGGGQGILNEALPTGKPLRLASLVQCVERAAHPSPTLVEYVRVDHRRRYVGMPQEFLHRTNVVAAFEQ